MCNDDGPQQLLTEAQKALMCTLIGFYAPKLLPIAERVNVTPVPLEQRNQLRSYLMDEFVASGLRDDWEPNEYGLEISDIVSALGP